MIFETYIEYKADDVLINKPHTQYSGSLIHLQYAYYKLSCD